MKTGLFQGSTWLAGIASATLLLSLGCTIQKTDAQNGAASANASGVPVVAVAPQAPAAPVAPLAPSAMVVPSDLSPGVAELVKLVRAQVEDDVLLAYAGAHASEIHPTSDEVVYLTDLGVSDKVMSVLLNASTPEAPAPEAAVVVAPAPIQATPPPSPSPAYVVQEAPAPAQPVTPQVNPAPATPYLVTPAPQVDPPQPVVVSTEVFHDSLAPYGAWVEVPGYGLCWQPAVVIANPEWRPYYDHGHWIYTDCGWYWESDYSWGWAPFHYGRWVFHGPHGWVWRPDGVWGPSWVSWRHSDLYCGWAPLPPEARFEVGIGLTFRGARVGADFDFQLGESAFCFIEVGHFYDRHPDHFRIPRHEVLGIYHGSIVRNNYSYRGSRFVNGGFNHDRIGAAAHIDIRPVAVKPMGGDRGPGRMEHFDKGSRTMEVYQPHSDGRHDAHAAPVRINKGPESVREASGRSGGAAPHASPFNPVSTPPRAFERSTPPAAAARSNTEPPHQGNPEPRQTHAAAPAAPAGQSRPVSGSRSVAPVGPHTPPAAAQSRPDNMGRATAPIAPITAPVAPIASPSQPRPDNAGRGSAPVSHAPPAAAAPPTASQAPRSAAPPVSAQAPRPSATPAAPAVRTSAPGQPPAAAPVRARSITPAPAPAAVAAPAPRSFTSEPRAFTPPARQQPSAPQPAPAPAAAPSARDNPGSHTRGSQQDKKN